MAVAVCTAVISLPALFAGIGWLHVLLPLPVYYYSTLYGMGAGGAITVAAFVLAGGVALAAGGLPVLIFAATLLPAGFMLAKSAQRGVSLEKAAAWTILSLVLPWGLFGGLLDASSQQGAYRELLGYVDKGFDATLVLYRESGRFSPADLEAINSFIVRLKEQVIRLMPALLAIVPIGTVWLNIVAGQWLLRKKNPQLLSWGDLSHWRLPDLLVWVVIAAGAALVIPDRAINTVGLNLGLVLVILFASQGVAIVSHLLRRWSTSTPIRVVVYGLLFIETHGLFLVAMLGLADVWADFRTRWSAQGEDPAT